MTKQTSIEYLEEKLDIILPLDFEWNKLEKIINQAKQMYKEEMQERMYSEEEVIDLLQWLTDDKSIYSIMYGNKKYRFATNDKDFTSKELLEQFKKK